MAGWVFEAAEQIRTETAGTAVTTFGFDQAGNEQVVQTPSGLTTNLWDAENRLTGVQLPTGGLNTMAYRADNLRHQLGDSEGNKLMAWDEPGCSGYIDLVQERVGAAALRTYYRGFMLAAMRDEGAGANRYYHADHQGTTQALTDGTGAVTDRFASDAWGVQVKRTGSSINRQWYVGQLGYYRQVDGALDYVRARYLGVARGRWLSVDPFLPAQMYQYASLNPARLIDPTGGRSCSDPHPRTCMVVGILGRLQKKGDLDTVVEAALKQLRDDPDGHWQTMPFVSEYGGKPYNWWGDTGKAFNEIQSWFRSEVLKGTHECWCILAYSWGGGQTEKIVDWLADELPEEMIAQPIKLILTSDAIKVTPKEGDTEHHPVTVTPVTS